ncbi:MAG: NahK/ErcS family hybrid sensor histidine kinase/response regulator [Pseudomonadota bacterium]
MSGWLIAATALLYLAALFGVAAYGDRMGARRSPSRPQPNLYALSIGIYCTSWTLFGSVGLATERGFEFFAIFVGPILVFTFGAPLIHRVVHLSKAERITTIADFLGARYGKSARVAGIAAVIAVVGTVPYIALQLKAVSDALKLLFEHAGDSAIVPFDISIIVAVTLAAFTVLFGTRHADATEHQDGLMLAVAVESAIKLAITLAVSFIIIFFLFGGFEPVGRAIGENQQVRDAIGASTSWGRWVVLIVLSASAILLLPRQFHVIVVEHRSDDELRRATWLFPLYLIVINLFVMPLAVSGMINLGDSAPADLYMIALPLEAGHDWLALLALIGGLSAASAMVIVACVALSVMISNDIILPLALQRLRDARRISGSGWSKVILYVRRVAIALMILAGTFYHSQAAADAQLASMGLLSFAAIAQFMPAFVLGLTWRGANGRGATLGLAIGFSVWIYTLLVPTLVSPNSALMTDGLLGLGILRPEAMFGLQADPLIHGVFWSLLANTLAVIVGSLTRASRPLERIQSITFIPREAQNAVSINRFSTSVTVSELKGVLARYLGEERIERSFDFFTQREARMLRDSDICDMAVVHYAEQVLASAIGSASARLVLSLVFEKDGASTGEAVRLLDDASEALQQNRDILQKALDQMDQGISVFDSEFRLTNWNSQFRRLLDLPPEFGNFGMPLKSIIGYLTINRQIDPGVEDEAVENITHFKRAWQLPLARSGRIIEIRTNPMPEGGLVVTYTDVTSRVEADEALKRTKESLEVRVQARTGELTKVNAELGKAQRRAEEANISKTRFLAAAGHDISQPLNAARLYATSLVESLHTTAPHRETVQKIDSALESVESIIGAVLDISRLDTGAMTPNNSVFALGDLLKQLETDFRPIADEKQLDLRVLPTSLNVETDRNLLRRLVQNLISNAIKYTRSGRVLVGVRRRGKNLELIVADTGIGIPKERKGQVFKEFQRLDDGARTASGLGLGLSIVDRISRVLNLAVTLHSDYGRGSVFSVEIPVSDAVPKQASAKLGRLVPHASLLTGLNIACIDNEDSILSGMTVLLSGWGAHVMAAGTLEALLKVIETNGVPPNVIIADYHLDNEDGISVIAEMRSRFGDELPGVLITADRSAELREETEMKNITLLNKPLKPAALRAILTSVPVSKAAAE